MYGDISVLEQTDITKNAEVFLVDPRKIVNDRCTRTSLARNIAVIKESIQKNGYLGTHMISCRLATAPEIEQFYKNPPYRYSGERACAIAKNCMKEEHRDGHVYAYDGLIRKGAVLELLEEDFLKTGFRMNGFLLPHLPKHEEIAYSLSCNVSNEYCVPLTVLAILVSCYEFDCAVNADRTDTKKWRSAAEVSRKMVALSFSNIRTETARRRMAETRRQYLSVSRRLPLCVIEYFKHLLETDEGCLQVAFTTANLKAIPLRLLELEALCLVKRMVKFYENGLPSPKPIHKDQVLPEVINLRRALSEISKLLRSCDYEKLPPELEPLVTSLRETQLLDKELVENANLEKLLPSLVDGCRNLVPGGSNRIAVAEKNILASQKPNENCENVAENLHSQETKPLDETETDGADNVEEIANTTGVETGGGEDSSHSEDTFVETTETLLERYLPDGWLMVNSTFETFAKSHQAWPRVEGRADLVIMELPREEEGHLYLSSLVRHAGIAMNPKGVAHVFCTFVQWGLIFQACREMNLTMMRFPMLYIGDSRKVKKRTLTQHPQNNCECAAVFWRASEQERLKHHFSTKAKYPPSLTAPWTNTVTNVVNEKRKVTKEDGTKVNIEVRSQALGCFLLEQWCKPAGFCYNPLANKMSFAKSCLDLGVEYVAIDEREEDFSFGVECVVENIKGHKSKRTRMNRTDKDRYNSMDDVCGVGEQLCRRYGPSMTFKCICGKQMHDLCDWPSLMSKASGEELEGRSVCSRECYEKEGKEN